MKKSKAADPLSAHAIKRIDGSIDEKAELRAIQKELKRLGLR